ncbi:MAG TPA: GMC family oxidoreductase [Myxococcales bacterium]|nr:GMC family oxidoreductase [Myxococcales bacterium]
MTSNTVVEGHHVHENQTLRCDVCIVGSGAGGSVLAAELTAKGLDVVMLEAGGYFTKADFDLQESTAFPAMYQGRGARSSADLSISVLQGRSVGGSTTVNWTTCFRTPERILNHWRLKHGIDQLSSSSLAPHFEAVERRLNIKQWDLAKANENNRKLLLGAKQLGWDVHPTKRNVKGCINSGFCGVGCPVDGKQAMHVTYLSDALEQGLRLYADCRVDRLEVRAGSVSRVHADILDRKTGRKSGKKLSVQAKVTVAAGGALNSPALLQRSAIEVNQRVGKRTFLHPVVTMVAIYPEPVAGYYGAPQSIYSHQFTNAAKGEIGYFLEAAPVQPMIMAQASAAHGSLLSQTMQELPNISAIISLSIDGLLDSEAGGTVSVREDGRTKLDYAFTPALERSFLAAHKSIAKLHLAAGAREVISLHAEPCRIRSSKDMAQLDSRKYGRLKHPIFTAHQMGGCAMGGDPKTSVVNQQHRVWGLDNLYVVDGSVLPTALGVNPSQTIYGLAHRASAFVAQRVS